MPAEHDLLDIYVYRSSQLSRMKIARCPYGSISNRMGCIKLGFRRVRFSQANCRDQYILACASAGTDYRLMTEDGYLPAMFYDIICSSLAYTEHKTNASLPDSR
ncbi:MAG: hypothetical protein GYA42_05480 [Syntrophomonadaceae bacterium]|nr:hypothetical protein [Syntrophomonadaceae bacterium]